MSHDKRLSVAKHGLRFRLNGLPIREYDFMSGWTDEPTIVGYVYEPRWNEADLTPRQSRGFERFLAKYQREHPGLDDLEARYLLLDWNGVEHTHRKGKPVLEYRPAYGFECSMCHAYIIAKDPGDAPFYGGPLDGRWVVTGGRPTWRVPVPVAITLTNDDPMPSAALPVIEYRRGRDGAYYVDRQTFP